jgi:AraC-like DNA-binding protein
MSVALNCPWVPPPPPWAQRFHSNDLDEVRSFVARQSGEHSRVAHRSAPLDYELRWLSGAIASVGWGRVAVAKTIRGALSEPTLHVVVPTGTGYRVGRREHVVGRATAMFIAPGWEFTRSSPPGVSLAIGVDGRMLADEIRARCPGGRGEWTFRTRSLELNDAERTRIVSAVNEFARALQPGESTPEHARGDARLVSAIADLLLRERAVVRAQEVTTARISDLEAWIGAHLDEPLTMGRLCEVAGVGERSLQKAFEARRGVSPMRLVAEWRLAEARRRLRSGDPRDNVTHVALGLGFQHMGRFAKMYREAFGEAPSQSRARLAR